MIVKFISSFYSKLVLAVLICFVIVAAILLHLGDDISNQYQQEVEQKLHLRLAEHLVHDNVLFQQGDFNRPAIKNAFHTMMILGPRFEFYMLDPEGKILNFDAEPGKVKRNHVDLSPINQFISGDSPLPLHGDDPRHLSRSKIFSVSPIYENEEIKGYLYIIIGGEEYDNVAAPLRQSHIRSLGTWGLLLTLTFSLVVIIAIFALLTRPIRRLAGDISTLHQKGFEQGLQVANDWNKDSKDEIQQLGHAFNTMANKLNDQFQKVQTADQLRRELISWVSHDLRTPLSSLQGYLETWQLKQGNITQEASENLIQIALNNAHKTSYLVDQLFELARLDSDNISLQFEPVAIAELVQDVIQSVDIQAVGKGVSVSLEPKDPTLMVMADIHRIERVFCNLLENAIRHCNQGDSVSVNLVPVNKRLHITIKDTGCGIPEQEVPHIFEPHYRASNTMSGDKLHSGLGLAISKRILELHHSKIKVHSEQHVGTSFTFELDNAA